MRYLKWQSEDGSHVIESMIGTITAEFVELSDSYLVPPSRITSIKMISDLRHALLHQISPKECHRLGKACAEQFSPRQQIDLVIVVEKEDMESHQKIGHYVAPFKSSRNISVSIMDTMEESYDCLSIAEEVRESFNRQIKEVLELG